MIEGHNTVLTAYTGSGKTVVAEAAILHYVKQGKRVIYCSPIKALSNEKCNSWKNKFPSISFGLITGDNKDNPEADVLIMTTECLQNQLLHRNENVELLDFKMDYEKECGTVIFDELHYLFTDRGDVGMILLLNYQITFLLLGYQQHYLILKLYVIGFQM